MMMISGIKYQEGDEALYNKLQKKKNIKRYKELAQMMESAKEWSNWALIDLGYGC